MHLTLKFMGDVEDREIPELCKTVQHAAVKHRRFEIECCGAGAFPAADRARTLWLGIDSGHELLSSLANDIDDALHRIGYAVESRKFHGHLTIGRVRDQQGTRQELARCLEDACECVAGRSQVREVVGYSSSLERGGPQYGVMARAPLS